MTIGIVAITAPDNYIVTVSDRMLSSGDIVQASDNAALKARKISKRWVVMFSATDANLFLPIVEHASKSLGDFGAEYDLRTVQDALLTAYARLFEAEFTSSYLVRYNIASIAAFRDLGFQKFGQERFDLICDAIDRFDLGINLLCYGYDKKKHAHIFEVSNPGKLTNHDLLGYAVIGSGSYMATAALRRKKLPPDLEMMIYRLLEAKFSAETASGVGRSTSLLTMNADGVDGAMGSGAVDKVRGIWETTLKEPEPKDALDIISKTEAVRRIAKEER
jgi:20S proteasome alpha/beta subunit